MKTTIKMVCAAIFAAFVGYNVYSTQRSIQLDVTLNDVEAIGACEISPKHENNIYYCSELPESSNGACVKTGSGAEPRCSGNL